MPNDRLSKRKNLMTEIKNKNLAVPEKQAVEELYNQIEDYNKSKKKLEPEDVDALIKNYEKCGVAFFMSLEELKKKNDNQAKIDLYQKLLKKYSKDCAALYRYKRRLEENPQDDIKLNIEEFFDNSRTRTISVGGKTMNELDKVGSGISVRHIIPMKVEDEPIEGVREGDNFFGFFTEDEKYDDNLDDEAISMQEDYKISQMLITKYPGMKNKLNSTPDSFNDWRDIPICLSNTDLDSDLRLNPTSFLAKKTEDQLLELFKTKIQDAKLGENEYLKDTVITELDLIKNYDEKRKTEAVHALVEYCHNICKSEFGKSILTGIGVNYKAPVAQRNSLMSTFADVLGCSNAVAFSEKVKVKVVENGEIVSKKGIVMVPAKGIDPSGTETEDAYCNMDPAALENSKGLVRSIASLQFLDYICGNTDRHGNNLFYQFDKNGKLIGVQGIDNDNSFGSAEHADRRGNAIPLENLGVIPKSMADAVKTMKPETYAMLCQGHGLSEAEIKARCDNFNNLKKKLVEFENHYKNAVPGYLDLKVPRIVPDNEMDNYSINEQLAKIGSDDKKLKNPQNLFGKFAGWSKRANYYTKLSNLNNKVMKSAVELEEALLVKNPGSIYDNVQKLDSITDAMTKYADKNGNIKTKKLKGEERKKYNAAKKMADTTRGLFTDKAFKVKYLVQNPFKLGDMFKGDDVYQYFCGGVNNDYVKNGKEFATLKDGTIENDERYIAFNAAFEATQEFLVEYSDIGMKYQELQENMETAANADERKNALKELNDYKKTNDCKLYLTAVENKKVLAEQLDKLVELHKNSFDLLEGREKLNKITNEQANTYVGSEAEKQAKKKVAEINEKQANQAGKMKKPAAANKK